MNDPPGVPPVAPAHASPSMRLRIGHGVDGAPVVVDTTATSLLCLVGDPGRGKTTIARYLTRWWLADPRRTARVFADQPYQYADLSVPVQDVSAFEHRQLPEAPASPWRLTVVDGADRLARECVIGALAGAGLVVVTSCGPAARLLEPEADLCLGLIIRADLLGRPGDIDQGRLDWPSTLRLVVPDVRGDRDQPLHRWEVLAV